MLLQSLNFTTVLEKEYVTIRHSSSQKFMWNEWRGMIPSAQLREAMIFSCEFILANEVELILADFTRLCAPTAKDQVWIATHTGELLKHSKLKKVANLLAQDFFQQIAIENIYEKAAELTMPCESRDFVVKTDAVNWLLAELT